MHRRSFLAAGAAALTVPLIARRAMASTARTPETLLLDIANNSGRFADTSIYLTVVGVNLSTGANSWLRPDGALVSCGMADIGPDGYANYSMTLAAFRGLALPRMSGRIYVSIGGPLKIRPVADAGQPGGIGLQQPAGWVPTDANYTLLHDWVEFTFDGGGMNVNATMVDMFSVPLALRLVGQATVTTGTLRPGGRDLVFDTLKANPDFARLIVAGGRRILAPAHGINAGLFPPDYLDSYITQCWTHYQSHSIAAHNDVYGDFTGQVEGSQLVFRQGGTVTARFDKPTTREVFFCNGALAAPNNALGALAAIIGAALNRTNLLSNAVQPAANAAGFYLTPRTNHYAHAMHLATVDGKAYGFAFDDVAEFSSYVADPQPQSLTLIIEPFGDRLFSDGFNGG
ncbi:beta-1,3-glucanase family protein [Tahibacter amnicola]|uniref:Beta-1,3-glucanase family protein n=1 Tax=Tahibacter amnicola TaxID=2976241 RepID=A0ABY6BL18_9GAMM|nr:beta-1,3-glucanase family protein [Tahibacter amnicola]UXI70464.1 beta-1,3-glucanase family protein [Tahibacter amnicola]